MDSKYKTLENYYKSFKKLDKARNMNIETLNSLIKEITDENKQIHQEVQDKRKIIRSNKETIMYLLRYCKNNDKYLTKISENIEHIKYDAV